jgi:hypothetical protein
VLQCLHQTEREWSYEQFNSVGIGNLYVHQRRGRFVSEYSRLVRTGISDDLLSGHFFCDFRGFRPEEREGLDCRETAETPNYDG